MENTSAMSEKTPSSTPSIDERDLVMSMRKLDLIKELGFVFIDDHLRICLLILNREKQSQFQRLQNHLQQNTDLVTRENQVLREFRKELDMLVQERMSHIEELRLIHADINIVRLSGERDFFVEEFSILYRRWRQRLNKLKKNEHEHCKKVNV